MQAGPPRVRLGTILCAEEDGEEAARFARGALKELVQPEELWRVRFARTRHHQTVPVPCRAGGSFLLVEAQRMQSHKRPGASARVHRLHVPAPGTDADETGCGAGRILHPVPHHVRDAAFPISTGCGTRRVHLERGGGRGREGVREVRRGERETLKGR